jgi:predicted NBD/HSP70 family sugar kinase
MDHFAGLDVSVKETSVCIVDDTGKIIREVKVASEPKALLAVLENPAYHLKRFVVGTNCRARYQNRAVQLPELRCVVLLDQSRGRTGNR